MLPKAKPMKSQMPETPESNKEVNNQLEPNKMSFPKRGAFPTPRAEIEKAKPYVPKTHQENEKLDTKPVSPENVDQGEH